MFAEPTFVDDSCWAHRSCVACLKGCSGRHGGKLCCTCNWSRVRARALDSTLYACSECKAVLASEYSKEQERQAAVLFGALGQGRLLQLSSNLQDSGVSPPADRRKTCGHDFCLLQIDTCCTCTDQRNYESHQYRTYLDGKGFTTGSRFDNYCTSCRSTPTPVLGDVPESTLPFSKVVHPVVPEPIRSLSNKTRTTTGDAGELSSNPGTSGNRALAQSPFKKNCGHRCYYIEAHGPGAGGVPRCCACSQRGRRTIARAHGPSLPEDNDFCRACSSRFSQKMKPAANNKGSTVKAVPATNRLVITGMIPATRHVDITQLSLGRQADQLSREIPVPHTEATQAEVRSNASLQDTDEDFEVDSVAPSDFELLSIADGFSVEDDFSVLDESGSIFSWDGTSLDAWEDTEDSDGQ